MKNKNKYKLCWNVTSSFSERPNSAMLLVWMSMNLLSLTFEKKNREVTLYFNNLQFLFQAKSINVIKKVSGWGGNF